MQLNLPQLPPRSADAHKGDFGRALLIGGSRGMGGAISLAGMACLRSGAGLVKLAVPESILDTVASFEASYMTVPLPDDSRGQIKLKTERKLLKQIRPATCVACGPGLGRSKRLESLVRCLFECVLQPMVIDADGLNNLAASSEEVPQAAGPRILTPHPREFARLTHRETQGVVPRDEQIEAARQLAHEHRLIIVLKGHRTVITDGMQTIENTTGNPGMATGGTGDILTGVITALVCQGLSPLDAAVLGVHVHGLAGDLAAAELGQVSLIASDLLRFLPQAFQQLQSAPQ
jgi:NAD(P)H-hydrate epimerase